MLRTKLIHPEILEALGSAGHGSVVLVADGNYPFSTGAAAGARRVYLNFAPGLLTVPDVLRVLVQTIPVESVDVIVPDNGDEPPIFPEFRQIFGEMPLAPLTRFPFYDKARSANTALVIATGEQHTYACVLLTIGVILAS